jgi:hypothetical protein
MKNQVIYYKEVAPGRWLAASSVSPYFCVESDSRESVFAAAGRALAFYDSADEELHAKREAHRERTKAVPTFDHKHTISARDLAAA